MFNEEDLLKSYNIRFESFLKLSTLKEEHISYSREYFKQTSLVLRDPIPLNLDVYCVVAGLPFEINFINFLKNLKKNLSSILDNSLHYLVKDSCHALELLVTKWPNDILRENINKDIINYFKKKPFSPINIKTNGIQVHDDGCIILRCIDENSKLRLLRKDIVSKIDLLPKKQSNWVHIPLGRILEPLNFKQTKLLKNFCIKSQNSNVYKTTINKFHFVHEQQWYQTQINYLSTFNAL